MLTVITLIGTLGVSGLGQDCAVSAILRAVDKRSHPVVDISAADLKAAINGNPATIQSLSPGGMPQVILMLDASSSMKDTWSQTIAAARQLVASTGQDIDTVVFAATILDSAVGRPKSEKLLDRLSTQPPTERGTALYDALITVASRLKTRNTAIVVISDGGDNASRYSSDATVSLFLNSSWPPVFGLILDYYQAEKRRGYFKKIPAATGGLLVYPSSPSEVPGGMEALAATISSPFILSLQPSQPISKVSKLKLQFIGSEGKPRKNIELLHASEVAGCDIAPSTPAKQQ
ncbi:MAG: VWA domain-containing protein [Terriglobales bacterium]